MITNSYGKNKQLNQVYEVVYSQLYIRLYREYELNR